MKRSFSPSRKYGSGEKNVVNYRSINNILGRYPINLDWKAKKCSVSPNQSFQSHSQKRVESLDWLRGLMALSIMIYHLCGWYFYQPDSSHFLGRMGIYGVSVFFILSGLSMAIVYHRFIDSAQSVMAFFIRRFFRILPLLWLAIVGTLAIRILKGNSIPDSGSLLLNATGLFGFVPPFNYIAVGSWSIGCEMVFYALTPFLLMAFNYRRWVGNLVTVVTIIIGIYFGYHLLHDNELLSKQWNAYIHPFNNLFLYTLGIAIYYNLKDVILSSKIVLVFLAIALLGLFFYPADGNQIEIVTGSNRIVFTLLSALLVIGFYKFNLSLPYSISYPLEKLGLVTYGVYILHPIIKVFVSDILVNLGVGNVYLIASLVVVTSISAAFLSYYCIEIHLMRIGKQLTAKK